MAEDKQSLSDHVNQTVAQVGEKIRLRRAALISTEMSSRIAVLTHGSTNEEYKYQGQFGTVLVYKANDYYDHTHQLAKNICQQIIGKYKYRQQIMLTRHKALPRH